MEADYATPPSQEPTSFTEANALLAAQRGDRDTVRDILSEMLPGELASLIAAVENLATEARTALRNATAGRG